MLRIIKALLWGLLILGIAAAAVVFTGNAPKLFALLTGPQHGWDLSKKAPDPDYAKAAFWAALPGQQSLALMVPEGVAASPGAARPSVFFVHPTGHLHGGDWNSPLDPNSRTEENTKWMMANQASVFSSCCDIY
ncbi:MAG TPA: hypothetical protein DCL48_01945, partial [Alphaproteobacteria bacterium]|nr:hypothetical protein [Alphaproteobacteria bacterium]